MVFGDLVLNVDKMKYVLLLALACYITTCEGLECGLGRISNDQFKKVVTECVKNNQTMNKIWDLASNISSEEDNKETSSEEEEVPVKKGVASNLNSKGFNKETSKSRRTKRSKNSKRFNNDSPMSNVQRRSSTTTESTTTMQEESEEHSIGNNIAEMDDMCVLQCVFEKLEMTDSNGLPDHKKFAAALLKTATGREIRDFLQESTDECFQQIEQEDSQNPCEYSAKLLSCLGEKGKANCEDWPTGNLPF